VHFLLLKTIKSYESFYIGIYQEHLFETGANFTQINSYFCDSGLVWFDVFDLIEIIEAHIDAIELGGPLAFQCAIEFLESSDEDEFVGAIYTLASICSNDFGINELIEYYTKEGNEEKLLFYVNAFKSVKHSMLTTKLLSSLQHEIPIIRAATAEILGYRGDADPHRIWPLFHDKEEFVRLAAMVAVMRLGFKNAVPAMEQAVLENKAMFNEHCVFPLLMLGSQKALKFSRLACQSASYIKPQYPIYLALGGDEDDLPIILKALEFQNMNSAVLEALGIFGSLKGVNTLIKFLSSENDEERLAAAKSLNQISGAELYETLSVVEKEDDDISAEDITGKPSTTEEKNTAGDERLIEIKQDCTDKERWTIWWKENASRFNTTTRYRSGKPYSFLLCLEEIAHPQTKYDDRQRAYNELVMRSGHHIPFEPGWFVDKQIDSLKKWQTWWNENKTALTNPWMFDGN